MVQILFERDYSMADLRKWIKRVQPLWRGTHPIQPFEWDRTAETVTIDRAKLERVLMEH